MSLGEGTFSPANRAKVNYGGKTRIRSKEPHACTESEKTTAHKYDFPN